MRRVVTTVGPTIPDTPSQQSQNDDAENQKGDQRRERSPKRNRIEIVDSETLLTKEISPCEVLDLGGSGDCVFKACVFSLGKYQGKDIKGESLTREATRLRVLAVEEVKRDPLYKQSFAVDTLEEPHHRGGAKEAAQTFDEYLEMVSKKQFYGDGFLIQAVETL